MEQLIEMPGSHLSTGLSQPPATRLSRLDRLSREWLVASLIVQSLLIEDSPDTNQEFWDCCQSIIFKHDVTFYSTFQAKELFLDRTRL